ncbi:MAG: hypothetical protein AAFN76_04790 [Pseudomonadota bacterium]
MIGPPKWLGDLVRRGAPLLGFADFFTYKEQLNLHFFADPRPGDGLSTVRPQ